MNRRDWELLDRQLQGVQPRAPVNNGALSLAFIAVFVAGLGFGGWLFANNQMQRSNDQMIALLFHTDGSPPTMR